MRVHTDVGEVIERIDHAFFALDEHWQFTYLNERAAAVLDVDPETSLGEDVRELSTTVFGSVLEHNCLRAMETGETVSAEEYVAPSETWFEVDVHPSASGLSVSLREASERREQEQERPLELYERIVETVDDGVYVLDPDNRFEMVNDAFCEMTGYSREELVGRHATTVKDEHVVEEIDRVVADIDRRGREDRTVEFELLTKGGDRTPVEDRLEQLPFGTGIGRCGIVRDISERRKRERELDRTRALLARTERIADVGGWELHVDSEDAFWSDHLLHILGVEDGEELSLDEVLDNYVETDRRKIERAIEAATTSGEEFDLEARIERPDGERRWLHIQGVPVVEDGDVVTIRGAAEDVTERKAFERRLISLHDVAVDLLQAESSEEIAERVAATVADILGAPAAWFYRYDRSEGVFRPAAVIDDEDVLDERLPVVETGDGSVVEATFETGETTRLSDLAVSEHRSLPGRAVGVGGMVVAAVADHGVLGAGVPEGDDVDEQTAELVDILATMAAVAFDRVDHEQMLHDQRDRLAALNDIDSLVHNISESVFGLSNRGDIERLVCERLAESVSYEFAWIGTAEDDEVAVRAEAGTEEYLADIDLTLGEQSTADGPTATAHLTGEMQVVRDIHSDPRYEPWRDRGREYGYDASASIPIGDDARYGTLNVYSSRVNAFGEEERDALRRLGAILGYALASVERDRQLQYERNRLEFMNRLLRHNLLNSLNVVTARLEMLDGRVDYEMVDHLETAIDRTKEMATFVETIRKVTKIIGRSEEQELDSRPLDEVLPARVRAIQESYPDAEFALNSAPAVDVVADDLLSEVLDNVLVNAVQHNPADEPSVRVDTVVDDDEVAVTVADDGPGIPDERKEAIFDRETAGFGDPGSGFGLYLVKEILDSYGGSISVADNDPQGTVFRLTFRRP